MSNVRVRFPPSPTGYCHVGTARMAVLNYLFARKNGGTIIFRSEDTDKERSTKEFEDDILESLKWLGLSWDEFYRQSERTEVYRAALKRLVAEGKAYVSVEESKKEAGVKVSIIRLKNPGTKITFTDIIRGDITFDTTELKDFAIARAEDDPLYHLAVVVDDADMGITHVIRGDDHISNTPRQILIQEALGISRPVYAHYPLHLAADRSKLSKRTGDVAVRDYRAKGFLPEALLNYIATLGWTPPSGREIFSLEEMIAEFDLKDLHKSGAVFDMEKLRWYNREYLLKMSNEEFAAEATRVLRSSDETRGLQTPAHIPQPLIQNIRERISVWDDIRVAAEEGEFDFLFPDRDPTLDASHIPQKGVSTENTARHLEAARKHLCDLPEDAYSDMERIKGALWDYATAAGRGAVLWPLRYALTGKDKSPDPFVVSNIIAKVATLRRIDLALKQLGAPAHL